MLKINLYDILWIKSDNIYVKLHKDDLMEKFKLLNI